MDVVMVTKQTKIHSHNNKQYINYIEYYTELFEKLNKIEAKIIVTIFPINFAKILH